MLAWVVATAVIAGSTVPQRQALLAGVSEVKIVMEDVDDNDRNCNISGDSVRLAAARELIDGGLRVRAEDVVLPYLYISFSTLYLPSRNLCVSSFDVQIKVPGQFTSAIRSVTAPVFMEGFDDGGIMSSDRSEHAQRLIDRLRSLTRDAVTAVKLANQ